MQDYYDARAPEYDEWYLGRRRFAELDRPGWAPELDRLREVLAALAPARTLDVACGTGFLTQHLRGEITALDQSEPMLAIAAGRMPAARIVTGDALALPFADGSFERVFTGHFYGHLEPADRERFLAEARRLAPQLVVVDSARRADRAAIEPDQERILNDGSRYRIYKRYFEPDELATELGGGEVLLAGDWFAAVASSRSNSSRRVSS